MKEEKQSILDAATPRPWENDMLAGMPWGNPLREFTAEESIANWKLALIAVNSYEAQSALIERLVKALDWLGPECPVCGGTIGEDDQPYKCTDCEEIRAALAEAKKVQP